MAGITHVASPHVKPVLVFDGECRFCCLWVQRWQTATGQAVEYWPAQDPRVGSQFPELAREDLTRAVQLIDADGQVSKGAEAVFRLLARQSGGGGPLWLYRHVPGVTGLTEWSYRVVANHRESCGTLTRWLCGPSLSRPTYDLVSAVFLRTLGLIYLIAFLSLGSQILGLIGHDGILPATSMTATVRDQADQLGIGWDRYRLVPTLCWWSARDGFLQCQCGVGAVLALLVVAGITPMPCLALLWILYLSLATVGQDFLSFQWDNLLLETGWLAIFLAPLRWWMGGRVRPAPSRLALWLLRWLLFRLMFESACVKWLSGDALWHHLTALTVHYETQPLPTWIGWYAYQLPLSVQRASCALMFFIEWIVPFFIFGPRRVRLLGALALAGLQVLILLTGNYCFFNLLTLALCWLWLDDRAVQQLAKRIRMAGLTREDAAVSPEAAAHPRRPWRWPIWVLAPMGAGVVLVTGMELAATLGFRHWPAPVLACYRWVAPLRTFNNYGLFAVMTNPRLEIEVEGSNDGKTWRPYRFKYKPGDLNRRPRFVAPHQPRLDWQMWFAALGDYRSNPWFIQFCLRLLQGSSDVLALLEHNPFPQRPPVYLRAMVYEYHFTDWKTRRAQSHWWRRTLKGAYCPVLSLQQAHASGSAPIGLE